MIGSLYHQDGIRPGPSFRFPEPGAGSGSPGVVFCDGDVRSRVPQQFAPALSRLWTPPVPGSFVQHPAAVINNGVHLNEGLAKLTSGTYYHADGFDYVDYYATADGWPEDAWVIVRSRYDGTVTATRRATLSQLRAAAGDATFEPAYMTGAGIIGYVEASDVVAPGGPNQFSAPNVVGYPRGNNSQFPVGLHLFTATLISGYAYVPHLTGVSLDSLSRLPTIAPSSGTGSLIDNEYWSLDPVPNLRPRNFETTVDGQTGYVDITHVSPFRWTEFGPFRVYAREKFSTAAFGGVAVPLPGSSVSHDYLYIAYDLRDVVGPASNDQAAIESWRNNSSVILSREYRHRHTASITHADYTPLGLALVDTETASGLEYPTYAPLAPATNCP